MAIPVHTTKHLFALVKQVVTQESKPNGSIKQVLDSPAGSGALTEFLDKQLGLQVTAIEIDPNKWEYSDIPPLIHDMNQPMPFQDSSYDMAICLEGLKHFSNVNLAISEFARILRPDGILIISIPNDLCIQSRLRYLFDGFVDTDWTKLMDPKSPDEKKFFHLNSLVSLPYLFYFFEKYDLEFLYSKTSRYRGWSQIGGILLYPLIFFATMRSSPKNHPLRNQLRSFVWLAGRHNLIVLRKRNFGTA